MECNLMLVILVLLIGVEARIQDVDVHKMDEFKQRVMKWKRFSGRDGEVHDTLTPENAADLLFSAGWRTVAEINSMPAEDKRNTIIVELHNRLAETIGYLQGRDTSTLVAAGGLYLILKRNGWRKEDELRGMSIEDTRNTCIVELANKGYGTGSELQGLANRELVVKAANYYEKSNEPSSVISMTLHFDQVQIQKQSPKVLAVREFDNSQSSETLFETFSFTETNAEEESLGYSDEVTNNICTKVGISFGVTAPFFSTNANLELEVSQGTTETWTTNRKQSHTVEFKTENRVEVKPWSKLRVQLVIYMAKVQIPFTMEIMTKTGQKKTVTGTYQNVRSYYSHVEQKNIYGVSASSKRT